MSNFFCALFDGDCIAWQDNQDAPEGIGGAVGVLQWDGADNCLLISGAIPVNLVLPAWWPYQKGFK